MPMRASQGIVTPEQVVAGERFYSAIEMWAVISSEEEKIMIEKELSRAPLDYTTEILSIDDVRLELEAIAAFSS